MVNSQSKLFHDQMELFGHFFDKGKLPKGGGGGIVYGQAGRRRWFFAFGQEEQGENVVQSRRFQPDQAILGQLVGCRSWLEQGGGRR